MHGISFRTRFVGGTLRVTRVSIQHRERVNKVGDKSPSFSLQSVDCFGLKAIAPQHRPHQKTHLQLRCHLAQRSVRLPTLLCGAPACSTTTTSDRFASAFAYMDRCRRRSACIESGRHRVVQRLRRCGRQQCWLTHASGFTVSAIVPNQSCPRTPRAPRRLPTSSGVIDGVSFQTNVLALKRCRRAARAGNRAAALRWVASEVRSLAQWGSGKASSLRAGRVRLPAG